MIASAARATSVKELVAVCRDFAVSRSYCMRNRNPGSLRPAWNRADNPTFNRPPRGNPVGPQYRQQVNAISQEANEQVEEIHPEDILEEEEARQQLAIQWEEAIEEPAEINAIQARGTWPRDRETGQEARMPDTRSRSTAVTCWQCGNQGHTYPMCPSPKTYTFCYSCGNKGVTTRNCPSCASRWKQLAGANRNPLTGNR